MTYGEWLLLLQQNISKPNGLFTRAERDTFLSNTNHPTVDRFSIAGTPSYSDFATNGLYQFKLIFDNNTQYQRVWNQTSYLTDATSQSHYFMDWVYVILLLITHRMMHSLMALAVEVIGIGQLDSQRLVFHFIMGCQFQATLQKK